MHPEQTPLTIGLDLGDRRHTCCVLDSHGDILAEDTVTNDRQGLATFSAHYSLGPFGPHTALRQHGLHLATRGGATAKKRAVIATARKLSVLMLALWKTGRDYQPQPQLQAA